MCDPTTGACDTHFNAAAVASVIERSGRDALRAACRDALHAGMTMTDLARATGRHPDELTELTREDTL